MLLILTNSRDATADYLVPILERHGVALWRFNTDTSLSSIELSYDGGDPRLRCGSNWYRTADFENVWYRRPEKLKDSLFDNSPEAQFALDEWSEALEGYFAHIPMAKWMNHPSCNVAASHKIAQLSVARSLGLLVPDTVVTQTPSQLQEFFARHSGSIITKPMGRGYLERPDDEHDSLVYTNPVLQGHLDSLNDLPLCPTLFQQRIDKCADVRITVVDDCIHAVKLFAHDDDGSQRCDIRRDNMKDVVYQPIALPQDIERKLTRLMRHYSLRFAAIDMVVDKDGQWYFLEVNPGGQWAWLDLVGEMDIASSFVKSFESATIRS
jgi:hypothetical protein